MDMEIRRRSAEDMAIDDLNMIHNIVMHCGEVHNAVRCLEKDVERRFTGCDDVIAALDEAYDKIEEVHRYLISLQGKQRSIVRGLMK